MNKISIFHIFDGKVQFVSTTMNRVMAALTQKLDSMYYVTISFHYSFKKQASNFFQTVFCLIFKAA